MKITTLFGAFTLLAAASASTALTGAGHYYSHSGKDIYARNGWGSDDPVYGRDVDDMAAHARQELGARYLDPSYELTEREFAEIEKRQMAQAAKLVMKGIMKIVEAITGAIQGDKDKRGRWTSELVGKLSSKFPLFNFAVCHTDHKMEAKGKQGHDWGHIHHEVPVSFGKTVGYEIYWFREGVFHRYGDGGYLNWAYIGNYKSSNGGKDVTFSPRG